VNIYLAMKHPEHPYQHGTHTEAGTVEKAFYDRKAAQCFVDDKNTRSLAKLWSVKAKKIDGAYDKIKLRKT